MPVISINLSGLESNPGFKLTLPLIKRVCYGAVFGDILMKCVYRMRPYELDRGISSTQTQESGNKRVISFLEAAVSAMDSLRRCVVRWYMN